ncbi:MAG: hypothetical protein Q4A99_04610 [Actinomyces sp.]|nr:hypothetical protein [Actinomyces sp.]MDO4654620.1 hypothetical protein [Actinomyces sp.]
MFDRPLAVDSRCQQRLHRLVRRSVDQGLMAPGIVHALVDHLPGVEGVVQYLAEQLHGDGLLRQRGGWHGGQTAQRQLFGQALECPLPTGIGRKGPGHQGPTYVVHHHDARLLAILRCDDVAVTQRCSADAATVTDFLGHTFLHLIGEVLGVELGDTGHNAVHQQPTRRLIDILAGRHQPNAELIEALTQGGVVVAVTHQAVELVDDDVVDRPPRLGFLLQVAQHRLESRAPRGSGADPALGELLADDRADAHRFALVGRPLGRDGEALLTAAPPGLLAGRDAQVGHGAPGSQFLGQLFGRVLDGGRR